jgi:hypothetical protein
VVCWHASARFEGHAELVLRLEIALFGPLFQRHLPALVCGLF